MRCPVCGNSEMITKIQDETLSYGGQSLTLHLMKGDFCPACGEGIWDGESYHRYTEAQTAIMLLLPSRKVLHNRRPQWP